MIAVREDIYIKAEDIYMVMAGEVGVYPNDKWCVRVSGVSSGHKWDVNLESTGKAAAINEATRIQQEINGVLRGDL